MKGKSIVNSLLARVSAGVVVLGMVSGAMAEQPNMDEWAKQGVAGEENLAISVVLMEKDQVRYVSTGHRSPGGEAIDPDTQFQIGSITKAYTNMLLAEMVASGTLKYSTTVGDLLGDDVDFSNPGVADITLQQLATHTSGLPRLPGNLVPSNPLDPYAGYNDQALMQGVASARSKQQLGNHYGYSNFGVGLLGYLLGIAGGSDYSTVMEETLLSPLGLEHTGFRSLENQVQGFRGGRVVPAWGMDDALAGAGVLWGSASDFERLTRVFLRSEASGLKQTLSGNLEEVAETGIGFGLTRVWHVAYADGKPVYWHNGGTGGFWSFYGFRPDSGQAVAILVSGNDNPTDMGLEWLGATPNEIEPKPVDRSLFGQYDLTAEVGIGVYETQGVLVAQVTGQPAFPIVSVGDDWYAYDTVDASLRFVRSDEGVAAVELAQGGVIQTAKRTAEVAAATQHNEITLAPDVLEDYVGEYAVAPGAAFTIRVRDGGLEAMLTGQPFLPIFPREEDVFFYKVVDAELHFERASDGTVNALVLRQGQIVQRAEKT